ncbi:nucleoside monophosphate kinase [Streptomyces sp. SL13]|uniref:Adenylate kinase n=1 Tax=Streptantibioticus silvisoli TaxID=2705255 RepID=A0AA90H2R8_9ACTN|nr:nucleoside monophosphate kinase [Streptantibioticus silvisoli]MDI5970986.1 nucleoside monophosphate kinase [Streptantibioticus silvisoli]
MVADFPAGGPVPVHLVIGPPGCGKTTALSALARLHPWLARFGVRDYGLRLAALGDPLGLAARETLLRQGILPDALVRDQFTHFLDRLDPSHRAVVVEGYPRSPRQCADLDEAVGRRERERIAGLVIVEVPDDVAFERVSGRRICADCGTPAPAGRAGCEQCGGRVVTRRDDTAARFAERLAEYHGVAARLRGHFAARDLVRTVDGTRDPQAVRTRLQELLLAGPARPEPAADRAGGGAAAR